MPYRASDSPGPPPAEEQAHMHTPSWQPGEGFQSLHTLGIHPNQEDLPPALASAPGRGALPPCYQAFPHGARQTRVFSWEDIIKEGRRDHLPCALRSLQHASPINLLYHLPQAGATGTSHLFTDMHPTLQPAPQRALPAARHCAAGFLPGWERRFLPGLANHAHPPCRYLRLHLPPSLARSAPAPFVAGAAWSTLPTTSARLVPADDSACCDAD